MLMSTPKIEYSALTFDNYSRLNFLGVENVQSRL